MKKTVSAYPLPDNLDPDDTICIPIRVPNDPQWLAVFWGHLHMLTRWFNHDRDEHKRARLVARRWFSVVEQARVEVNQCGGDMLELRQDPDNPCSLELRRNNAEWEQWANLRLCSPHVAVTAGGGISINGGDPVFPNAPLGLGDENFPIQPQPLVIDSPDRVCSASLTLAEILAQAYREVCARISLNPLQQALAAVAVFTAVVAFPPNVAWAIPLVLAIATVNNFCSTITYEDMEDLTCILKQHATESDELVTFNKQAIINALTVTNRPVLMAIALIINYLDDSALNYAASLNASVLPCPCPIPEQTVWLLSRADFSDQTETSDIPRSRFWESLTYNPATGLNRIVLRFDNVAAAQGLPSIGVRIRSWNSLTTFDNTTRTRFYVNELRFTRANSAGQPLSQPAQLQIWPDFGSPVQYVSQTGSVSVRNLWAAQINTNAGTNGFNNNSEYWILEFSIRTGRDALSLRATNSLGQTVNWSRYP